jgi:catechol 2,3-dioxygenase-like lactoylglutathione lyase family enzyme
MLKRRLRVTILFGATAEQSAVAIMQVLLRELGDRLRSVELARSAPSALQVKVNDSLVMSVPGDDPLPDPLTLGRSVADQVRWADPPPEGEGATPELQHVTVFYPHGRTDEIVHFYSNVLGIPETPRPGLVLHREGAWFQAGPGQIHLTPDSDLAIHPRRHFGLRIENMDAMEKRLAAYGVVLEETFPFPGWQRMYCRDPFGNKVELDEIHDDVASSRRDV